MTQNLEAQSLPNELIDQILARCFVGDFTAVDASSRRHPFTPDRYLEQWNTYKEHPHNDQLTHVRSGENYLQGGFEEGHMISELPQRDFEVDPCGLTVWAGEDCSARFSSKRS